LSEAISSREQLGNLEPTNFLAQKMLDRFGPQ
jgi:hypothetical protein